MGMCLLALISKLFGIKTFISPNSFHSSGRFSNRCWNVDEGIYSQSNTGLGHNHITFGHVVYIQYYPILSDSSGKKLGIN